MAECQPASAKVKSATPLSNRFSPLIKGSSGRYRRRVTSPGGAPVVAPPSPTACPPRGYWCAGTQNDRVGESFPTVRSTCLSTYSMCSYGLHSYGLYSYGLYSYGPTSLYFMSVMDHLSVDPISLAKPPVRPPVRPAESTLVCPRCVQARTRARHVHARKAAQRNTCRKRACVQPRTHAHVHAASCGTMDACILLGPAHLRSHLLARPPALPARPHNLACMCVPLQGAGHLVMVPSGWTHSTLSTAVRALCCAFVALCMRTRVRT